MAILSNLYVILILRVLHIGGGIMWVGSATLYLLLLIPVARSLHPAGQKFLQTLGPKFGAMMGLVTTVTVLSGACQCIGGSEEFVRHRICNGRFRTKADQRHRQSGQRAVVAPQRIARQGLAEPALRRQWCGRKPPAWMRYAGEALPPFGSR